ncbi:signal recognition particle-docking protein FtsY [Brachyspira hyodysenteriae]|uniref:signal recognition particle-docking protein FtsY n=1 Tax=Brachyspira hyodysenteriae TaxID=159 RepID=UPI0022CD8E6A|nr:signal recognition particle-docking protein FtsY [Brachyspira hyodysenteriae]MCZ9891288.1 signal recognition particle-docking protein FtsY [Brachyspira hyodysenteriae]MCZ9988434.1 signal recognition particle-docking protein FtsY [Brachyspira hyodysenteriae]MCZ9997197.1 signal recognition particle-docking protein FtsY [Brachyspira hyodysenteriae]MDA0000637.1 signal recognition particle-docking protein FtsY [Brachyspira hyodysenteriae]MDA0028471.1 signal recognition particle-docking protein F
MSYMNIIIIACCVIIALLILVLVLKKKSKKPKVSLTSSKSKFSLSSLFNTSSINDEFFASLENTLITADAGVETTKDIISKLRDVIEKENIKEPSEAKKHLREILISKFISKKIELNGKTILFVVGVNGVGKTTSIAKLANILKKDHKVILAAADTFRAAAIEQLEEWANRLSVTIVKGQQAGDPASVLFSALDKAKATDADIVIVDTAGRFHNQENLVRQLEKMKKIATERFTEFKFVPILVLDANVGHNGIEQAKVFTNALDIQGAIVSKLDSTAKGGVAISIAHYLSLPIYYGGFGEKVDDFKEFDAESFVDSILQ